MLRNSQQTTKIVTNFRNHRILNLQHGALCNNKNSSNTAFKQGKIMGKLFGNRIAGSKKKYFPISDSNGGQNVIFQQSQFGKPVRSKNDTRRMTVLNKLFMKHITDMMATGEISENILGKGLQISRVKTTQDFAYVNVYWLSTGDVANDILLEHELQKSAGVLRHELSQLGLMGVVPRIKFVKDKLCTNINQVEALLKNMDFDKDEERENEESAAVYEQYAGESLKQEFYGSKYSTTNLQQTEPTSDTVPNLEKPMPEMRHDVMGLDHKGILFKILTKMRKSKQAWDQHQQNESINTMPEQKDSDETTTLPISSQLHKISNKLNQVTANSEKFQAFLAKRTERKNTPERKKYHAKDHQIDMPSSINRDDSYDAVLSVRQRRLLEAEDYLYEDEKDDFKK